MGVFESFSRTERAGEGKRAGDSTLINALLNDVQGRRRHWSSLTCSHSFCHPSETRCIASGNV